MDQGRDSAVNRQDHEDALVEAIAQEALDMLVQRGLFTPFTAADGTIRYRKTHRCNRFYLDRLQRQS